MEKEIPAATLHSYFVKASRGVTVSSSESPAHISGIGSFSNLGAHAVVCINNGTMGSITLPPVRSLARGGDVVDAPEGREDDGSVFVSDDGMAAAHAVPGAKRRRVCDPVSEASSASVAAAHALGRGVRAPATGHAPCDSGSGCDAAPAVHPPAST